MTPPLITLPPFFLFPENSLLHSHILSLSHTHLVSFFLPRTLSLSLIFAWSHPLHTPPPLSLSLTIHLSLFHFLCHLLFLLLLLFYHLITFSLPRSVALYVPACTPQLHPAGSPHSAELMVPLSVCIIQSFLSLSHKHTHSQAIWHCSDTSTELSNQIIYLKYFSLNWL